MQKFINDYKYQLNLPRSVDLIARLKSVSSKEEQQIISSFTEDISIYSNYVKKITYQKEDKRYKVKISAACNQYNSDSQGKLELKNIFIPVDIGLFDKQNNPIYLKKHMMEVGLSIVIYTDVEPSWGGIDPYNKLIDKYPDDNMLPAKEGLVDSE